MKNSKKIIFAFNFASLVLSAKAAELNKISASYTGNEDSIVVKNTTDKDFWIVVKYGGKLVATKAGPVREAGKGEVILFSSKIDAKTSNNFDKKRYDNITIRIFKNEDGYKAYSHTQSVFATILDPALLAGLKEISIIKTNGDYKVKLEYNFIEFKCPICFSNIEESEMVGILKPCGHKYHFDCIWQAIKKNPKCPECGYEVKSLDKKKAKFTNILDMRKIN